MKENMVNGRWSQFMSTPESEYDVFVLQYRFMSAKDEHYSKGQFDGMQVFRSMDEAEDEILNILRSSETYDGLNIKYVHCYYNIFTYYASDRDYDENDYGGTGNIGNWTIFKITPLRFA